ncbi:MAG: S26 family signal peptidase [Planctomycetota bacterium]
MTSPDPKPAVITPTHVYLWAFACGMHGAVCLYMMAAFGLHPGDPLAFYAAVTALATMGFSGLAIALLTVQFTRARFIIASALLLPHLVASIWLTLMFGLLSPNPGGGTGLGLIGMVGLVLGRVYASALRNYSLVKAYVPERLGAKQGAVSKGLDRVAGLLGGHLIGAMLVSAPQDEEHSDNWVRDNLESVLIALIMALVIRTYSLEAFKIPTGSMKQTLVGDNKESAWNAPQFDRMSDSDLIERAANDLERAIHDRNSFGDSDRELLERIREDESIGLARRVPRNDLIGVINRIEGLGLQEITRVVRSGDKILVNKLAYYFADPQRWEIIVFKYPLNTKRNFIKRLTGLGGEELVIYRGDIWTRPAPGGRPEGSYQLQRKPGDVQDELWIPFYDLKYAGFTIEPRKSDGTLYGIYPLAPDGMKDATEWKLPACPLFPDMSPGRHPVWTDWVRADWVVADPCQAPTQLARDEQGRIDRENGDNRMMHRVWWAPPLPDAPSAWTATAAVAELAQPDDPSVPGFVAAPSAQWSGIGFCGDIVDRFELPASRSAYELLDVKDRQDIEASSQHHLVSDIRVRARVRLAGAGSKIRFTLFNDRERLQLTLCGDGTADLRTLPLLDDNIGHVRATLPADENALETPSPDLSARLAARGLAIRAGEPFELAFGDADRRATIEINGVPVPFWDYTPAPFQQPEIGTVVDRDPPERPTTLLISASGDGAAVGHVKIDRDIHYFAHNDPAARYVIPADNFLVLGDNCHSSKDSRMWHIGTIVDETSTGMRETKIEPDPTSDTQHPSPGLQMLMRRGLVGQILRAEDRANAMSMLQAELRGANTPREGRIALLEDTAGVVQSIDLLGVHEYRIERAPFVPRRNLIGRALLRFWPTDESRFIH